MQVRRASADEILDLRRAALRPGRPRDDARFPGDLLEDSRHWALMDEDTVIGCVSVLAALPPDASAPMWQLRGMAVAEHRRDEGLGGALLTAVHTDVGQPMWCNARLRAVPFYARHGWVIGSPAFDIPGIGPHHRMTWSPPMPAENRSDPSKPETLFQGRFLQIVRARGWEWCQRVRASGVVGIIAVAPGDRLILVEQPRTPVGTTVIELPAGLAGDLAEAPQEAFEAAARRELLEETGYEADEWTLLTDPPASAGLTDERMQLFLARGLRRTGTGGGDGTECITLHEVPLAEVQHWLSERRKEGALIDARVFSALFFLGQTWDPRRNFAG